MFSEVLGKLESLSTLRVLYTSVALLFFHMIVCPHQTFIVVIIRRRVTPSKHVPPLYSNDSK